MIRRSPVGLRRTVAALALLVAPGCDARLPFSHPSLEPYRRYEQRPSSGGALTVRFLGTSSLLFDDGATAVLSDGFVSRPGIARVLLARIAPDRARVRRVLERLGVDSIAAVFAIHSHYDHAMDAPVFAQLTGAALLGSPSTANIGRGLGVPERQLRVVRGGEPLRFGAFELTFVESRHSPGDRAPGTVDAPLVPPARAWAWKTGTPWSVLIRHGGRTMLVHGSANYIPGALRGRRADVVYLGMAGLGKLSEAFARAYWTEVVRATGARRVILVHWDDFLQPLDEPLQPLPWAMDDFPTAMRRILALAAEDGVDVQLAVPWAPTDPFAGLR